MSDVSPLKGLKVNKSRGYKHSVPNGTSKQLLKRRHSDERDKRNASLHAIRNFISFFRRRRDAAAGRRAALPRPEARARRGARGPRLRAEGLEGRGRRGRDGGRPEQGRRA